MFASLQGANQVARFISSTCIFSRLLALYSESLSRTYRVATGDFTWSCERSFRSDAVGRTAPSSSWSQGRHWNGWMRGADWWTRRSLSASSGATRLSWESRCRAAYCKRAKQYFHWWVKPFDIYVERVHYNHAPLLFDLTLLTRPKIPEIEDARLQIANAYPLDRTDHLRAPNRQV